MADRYTYLPAVGIFIIFAWSAADAIARWRWLETPLSALAALAVAACCFMCNAQVRLWASTKTLFEHTVAVTSDTPVALTILGLVALNEDRYADAKNYLDEALRLDPAEIDALGNVANLCRKLKNYEGALNAYRRILRLCPGNAKCLNLMADTFELQGKHADAIVCLQAALQVEPESVFYRGRLAQLLQSEGKPAQALQAYLDLVKRTPNDPRPRNNAAWILATNSDPRLRNGTKAVELLLPVAQGPGCDSNLLDTLATGYAESGQFDRAIETVQKAIGKARDESVLASDIAKMEKRLELYKKHQAYHEDK
jgi:tetratricopeptide (TPR) repeat protein